MAFSQPLSGSVKQKGQTALLCQLCEIEPKLKWKCLDCGLMMCQRCRDKVHPKFPSAVDHTIIDIKEISKHQSDPESRPDLTRIKCGVHSGQNCCLFCKTCQELVCQTCIAKTHNAHNFSEISHEYHAKLEKVKLRENEIKTAIQNLTRRKQQLKHIKSTEKSNYDRVKQEILDDQKALVNEIKKHTNKLLKELDQKLGVFTKSIEDEEKDLEVQTNQMEQQNQSINQILQSINAKDMFTHFDSLLKSKTEKNIPTSFHKIPKFTQGDRTLIALLMGKLENVTVQNNIKLQVDKSFQTDLKYIQAMVCCPDDSLWISDFISCILQKVKPHRNTLSVISNIKIEVFDAALLPSSDLLLSVSGSSNLKLIPYGSTNIQDSVYTVPPLKSLAVHVTKDNRVIVGAGGGQTISPPDGHRQVIVMDQTGHHKKVFQYDSDNKPLFTYPYRITSDKIGNIAVIDRESDCGRGRVVILNQEGGIRNIYTGHLGVNNEDNPLKPCDITTTPSDNFVVADYMNHTLHILNSEEEIITSYNTKEMGILLPFSLSFSITGQLYIGCMTYEDSKDNAKLFKIKKFLC